jgi:hypothetical protein
MSIGVNYQLWRKIISDKKSHFLICESVENLTKNDE